MARPKRHGQNSIRPGHVRRRALRRPRPVQPPLPRGRPERRHRPVYIMGRHREESQTGHGVDVAHVCFEDMTEVTRNVYSIYWGS